MPLQGVTLNRLRRLGIHTEPQNILLSAGAQNALSVILISMFEAGDKIAVDTDEYGMSPTALSAVCRNTEIKGIYLMPTCSNPTGIFMPQTRRLEIADIVRKYKL